MEPKTFKRVVIAGASTVIAVMVLGSAWLLSVMHDAMQPVDAITLQKMSNNECYTDTAKRIDSIFITTVGVPSLTGHKKILEICARRGQYDESTLNKFKR